MTLKGKQIGVLIALIFGLLILVLPSGNTHKYRFDPAQLAKSIGENADHIDPQMLAQWIIEGKSDYLLIDIRLPNEFAQGNIKGSENIPLEKLLQRETLESLPSSKLILLYSNGSSHAAQAWVVMKAAGFDSYILDGGLNRWNQVVLNPKAPVSRDGEPVSDDEILRYKAQVAVRNFFAGDNSTISTAQDAAGASPAVSMKKVIVQQPPKKKLKGC
ncbi:MAG: rhodanese-like domain-containing protein [Candidatus Omnitrophota bacterium]